MQNGAAPKVSTEFFPAVAPDTVLFDAAVAGNTAAAVSGQVVYLAAILQCLTCSSSLPNNCSACHAYKSHNALLKLDGATLSIAEQVPGRGIEQVATAVTASGATAVATTGYADGHTVVEIRDSSSLATVVSTVTLADVAAKMATPISMHGLGTVTSSLEAVPFAPGYMLWIVAARNTTMGFSFDTLLFALLSIQSSGGAVTTVSVSDVAVLDMLHLAEEFPADVRQQLLAVALDPPGVFTSFDSANKQVRASVGCCAFVAPDYRSSSRSHPVAPCAARTAGGPSDYAWQCRHGTIRVRGVGSGHYQRTVEAGGPTVWPRWPAVLSAEVPVDRAYRAAACCRRPCGRLHLVCCQVQAVAHAQGPLPGAHVQRLPDCIAAARGHTQHGQHGWGRPACRSGCTAGGPQACVGTGAAAARRGGKPCSCDGTQRK